MSSCELSGGVSPTCFRLPYAPFERSRKLGAESEQHSIEEIEVSGLRRFRSLSGAEAAQGCAMCLF